MHLKRRNHKVWIGELLVQKEFISQVHLNQALAIQRHTSLKLGEILIQQGLISPQQLQQVLNEQRWRNLVTALLLSVGTLAADLPKFLYAQVSSPYPRPSAAVILPESTRYEHSPKSIGGLPLGDSTASRYPLPTKITLASPLRGFCHPLNGRGLLTQGIRGRTHRGRMEYAYDLAVNIGTPVYAMRAGKVMEVRDYYPDTGGNRSRSAKFNYVWLEHDGGYRSVYVHLQQHFKRKVNLQAGQWVKAQQLIGFSGNSGWSSGPHLHIEVQKPGEPQRFSKTVPFKFSDYCPSNRLARQSQPVSP